MHGLWTTLQSRLRGEEEGASMIEYAFLIALIAIVVIAGAVFIGIQLDTKYSEVGSTVSVH